MILLDVNVPADILSEKVLSALEIKLDLLDRLLYHELKRSHYASSTFNAKKNIPPAFCFNSPMGSP